MNSPRLQPLKRLCLLIPLLLGLGGLAEAKQRIQFTCAVGGRPVTTSGINSSTLTLQSFPNCTVTVYNSAAHTIATIYSNNTGTSLANPFTTTNQGYGFFYAANGTYDVQLSGGGLASPVTIASIIAFDPADYTPSAASPTGSIQFNSANILTGSANLTYSGQTVSLAEAASGIGLSLSGGSYQAISSLTDGAVLRGLSVSQNTGATLGGYIVLPPVTYNPYDSSSVCLDIYGNAVQQPLPLPGGSFGLNDSVLWVGTSPSMPADNSCGIPLPVNPLGDLSNGLNTNSYFFARGGLATDVLAYNSIQSLRGGEYLRLGLTADQGFYPQKHPSSSTLNTPSAVCVLPDAITDCYGGFAYQGGSLFWYYNSTLHTWNTVDFASSGGGGGSPGLPAGSIQFNSTPAGTLTGSTNLSWSDSTQLLSILTTGTGVAGIAVSPGYIQSDQGFYATGVSGAKYNLFQAPNGGMYALSFTAGNYIQSGSYSAALASGPTFTGTDSPHPGALSYSTNSHCEAVYTDSSTWVCLSAGSGGVPAGAAGNVQFQSSPTGTFTASANLSWTNASQVLTILGSSSAVAALAVGTGFIQSDAGFYGTSGTANSWQTVNIPTGGVYSKSSYSLRYTQAGNNASGTTTPTLTTGDTAYTYGAMYFNVGLGAEQLCTTSSCSIGSPGTGWVSLGTASAAGVTSLNTLTGPLTLGGTSNQISVTPVGSTLVFSTPQNLNTTTNWLASTVSTTGVQQSTVAAGLGLGYQIANGLGTPYSVNGQGDISGNGSINMVGASSAGAPYKVNGTSVINASSQFIGSAVNVTGAIQSQITGASIAFQTSNSSFQADGNGNLSLGCPSGPPNPCAQINLTGANAAYKLASTTMINSSGAFVGNGVNVGGFGVAGAGYNVNNGGGSLIAVGQTVDIVIPGGFTVSGTTYHTLRFFGGILGTWN